MSLEDASPQPLNIRSLELVAKLHQKLVNSTPPVAMNLQVDNDHDPSSETCKGMLKELQLSSMSRRAYKKSMQKITESMAQV